MENKCTVNIFVQRNIVCLHRNKFPYNVLVKIVLMYRVQKRYANQKFQFGCKYSDLVPFIHNQWTNTIWVPTYKTFFVFCIDQNKCKYSIKYLKCLFDSIFWYKCMIISQSEEELVILRCFSNSL